MPLINGADPFTRARREARREALTQKNKSSQNSKKRKQGEITASDSEYHSDSEKSSVSEKSQHSNMSTNSYITTKSSSSRKSDTSAGTVSHNTSQSSLSIKLKVFFNY